MGTIEGLINYSQTNVEQTTTTNTLTFIPNKLYTGYFINQGSAQMTITFILINKQNQITELDPIVINPFNIFRFRNLRLYQIVITVASTPQYYSYNIFGINYKEDLIPDSDIQKYFLETPNGELFVNFGYDTRLWNGTPLSEDITVGTTAVQIDTTTAKKVFEVILKADSSNTAVIKIGSSSSQTYPLAAGQELHLHLVLPTSIYAISTTTGQILHVIYVY
ncbi:MAG: hypothetical protein QXP36_07655 [Conexivisphaerales archaeon]